MNSFTKTFRASLAIVMVVMLSHIPTAIAAGLTSVSDVMTRQQLSTASDHTIVFTSPSGVGAGETIILTFPTQNYATVAGTFDLSAVTVGDIDLQDDGVDVTLAGAAAGATWGVAIAGTTITFTNGTTVVAPGSVITIKIGTNATGGANQIVNPAVAGSWKIGVSGTFGDLGSFAVPTQTDDTVVITAEVEPYINFQITGTADYTVDFGTLTSAAAKFATDASGGSLVETAAHTMTADTNATGGYTLSVINGDSVAQPAGTLTSGAGDTITAIGAATASAAGTEQFGMRLTTTGGSVAATISAPYNGAAGTYGGGAELATTTVATVTGPTTPNSYSAFYVANVAPTTESGYYETSRTFIAVGNF
jgi:hypothetical protein